jgi:hypothetical protein
VDVDVVVKRGKQLYARVESAVVESVEASLCVRKNDEGGGRPLYMDARACLVKVMGRQQPRRSLRPPGPPRHEPGTSKAAEPKQVTALRDKGALSLALKLF